MHLVKAAGCMAAMVVLCLPIADSFARNSRSPKSPNRAYVIGQPYRIDGRRYYPREDLSYSRVGVASWYGRRFHGRRTANGETYDMNALTAAHPTLPLSTIVRVTNLANQRSITVRINDRGPFAKSRIIDMSRAGAQALGFVQEGTARVRVSVLRDATLRIKNGTSIADADDDAGAAGTTSSWRRGLRPAAKRRPPRRGRGR